MTFYLWILVLFYLIQINTINKGKRKLNGQPLLKYLTFQMSLIFYGGVSWKVAVIWRSPDGRGVKKTK